MCTIWNLCSVFLVVWMLSFKPYFSLSSFTLNKRLFSSYLLSAIRVVSSTYLRLLIFLLEILFPACASSSLIFHMMHSAYKLNKQGDNIHPCHAPFPILSQSTVPCCFLICIQVSQEARKVVLYFHLLKNFPQFVVIHSVKGFSIVNAAADVFLEFPCYFPMIQGTLAVWSLVPLPFLNPACTYGSSWFMYYWSLAWRILNMTLLACEMSTIVR